MATGKETYAGTDRVKDVILTKLDDDLTELFSGVATLTASSACPVSSDDTTPGYLDGKLQFTGAITYTVLNPAANEVLEIGVTLPTAGTTATAGVLKLASGGDHIAMSNATKAATPDGIEQVVEVLFPQSRPTFTYVTSGSITIGPGGYYLDGIGWVYWKSDITFTFGASGSNANSDALDASNWHYVAIDYSSVSSAGTISGSNFINRSSGSVTPTYSGTKGGVYQDTNDRTVFGVLTDASSKIKEFNHFGNSVLFGDYIVTQTAIDIDDSWTDIPALSIPVFTVCGIVTFQGSHNSWYWRTNGQNGTLGNFITSDLLDIARSEVITDSSRIIEVKCGRSDNDTIAVWTNGWKIPIGM